MRVLLDTQCWIWMTKDATRFNAKARTLIESGETVLYLSAASAWEIAIKHALGKLTLPEPPSTFVPRRMATLGVRPLAIEPEHALRVGSLPRHHADPFDRLLVAQAQMEDLSILTGDRVLHAYDVKVIAAA
jgi:PIN domain nuclease of toxin-antitoxin system